MIRPLHWFMESEQLRNLALRAEGRMPHAPDSWRHVGEGLVGALGILFDLLTPFLRGKRSHWGLDQVAAARAYPGDDLVPEPRWSWTHGIEIDAPCAAVWPWVAQLGADRGGFYSYQWLENLAGCDIQNADRIHPDWQELEVGDPFRLHPQMPPLEIAAFSRGRWFVVHGGENFRRQADTARNKGAANVSWLFFLEPLPGKRCRLVSRFRADYSDDLRSRLMLGPYLTEPIGFMMDRKMLLGIRERAEASRPSSNSKS